MHTLLLVDDHADIRRLIRLTLGKEYRLLEADNGVSALAMVRAERPQLVVLDIMMPGELDGLQVLDAIRSDPALKSTRVILVTARGQATDCALGEAHGADAYIVKPFSPLQLGARIRELLGTADGSASPP